MTEQKRFTVATVGTWRNVRHALDNGHPICGNKIKVAGRPLLGLKYALDPTEALDDFKNHFRVCDKCRKILKEKNTW